MQIEVFNEIKEFLDKHKVKYKVEDHEPTPRSEDAAKVRGTSIEQGAKALVFRSKGNFLMCVLSGHKKVDLDKVRLIIGEKRLSLASPDEVKKVTGCVIGSVPPFGNLFNIPLYVDKSILKNEEIAFNAGMLTRSIIMKSEDYINCVKPIVEDFSI